MRLSMFGPERYRCPASDVLKARGLRPRAQAAWKPEALEPFPNGPFMDAADELDQQVDEESPRAPRIRQGRALHDGVRQWTDHALRMYRKAFPVDPDLRLARQPWVYKHQQVAGGDQATVEFRITAWGRCLESADGRLRELRLPVNRLRARTEAERAIAALVAAEGDFDPRLRRVRVLQFALSDGRTAPIFEGTRDEALAVYREDGAPAVRALLDSREYRPGSACASCAVAPVCPALPRTEGLLGLADRSRPRRSWSPTTGRGHQGCPARGYLRGLRLPTDDAVERSAAVERGRAVHAFLAERHGRQQRMPCTPEVPTDWVPEGYRLPDAERQLGAQLLSHHAEVCPLRTVKPGTGVRNEPRLVFDDTAADLLVLADPDLLYQDAGSWVWRETKTSASDRPRRDLLAAYPQLALAVKIIGSGVLPGRQTGGRVELELLRPAGADLRILDPFAPSIRAAAEAILCEQVSGWHRETLFEAVPGSECASCEVAEWCSARRSQQPGPESAQ
ncbi:PD-(D/E)XK nuclease family protein [Streptomyces sp. 3213.3]|uniref:PD-(D/E)XK nuclease family protein n=1 Tax=Streptomyces sp. 3213.3 TaxID=1855348 RepID=UPI00190F07C5|nr:PD-(D/E)XK nuclease family protein [Streptomyces sp. 3213.3]